MSIKAIETRYKGYRFRSRLEARWAVFFNALKIQWEYEKQGYEIDGTWYLPDFWLPDFEAHLEIKPMLSDRTASSDLTKPLKLAEEGKRILVIEGDPWPWAYRVWQGCPMYGMLPFPTAQWATCLRCDKAGMVVSSCDGQFSLGHFPLDDYGPCGEEEHHHFTWVTPSDGKSQGGMVRVAYQAARSARFEHGETPQ